MYDPVKNGQQYQQYQQYQQNPQYQPYQPYQSNNTVLPPAGSTSPLRDVKKNKQKRQESSPMTEAQLATLNNAVMTQTFGKLLSNYAKGVLKAIPNTPDGNTIKSNLSFLSNQNNQDIALISLAGYDTWDTPINKLNEEQVIAGLRALSWVTTELVNTLSLRDPVGPKNIRETSLPYEKDAFAPLQHAINSISLLRAALILHDQQLPAIQKSSYQGSSSSSYSYSSTHSNQFSDVFIHWDPNYGYGYHHGYYDYHSGCYYHNHGAWGHGGHYGHCHSEPFPLAHELGEHVIAPVFNHTVDMYSNLFDVALNVTTEAGETVFNLGGEVLKAAGNAADHVINGANEGMHLLGDSIHQVGHGLGDCCSGTANMLGNGACDILHCAGNGVSEVGHCLSHVSHDFCGLLGNVVGGCGDILGACCQATAQCGGLCCDMLRCCASCGDSGCSCPQGDCGEAVVYVCGGVGAFCYGVGTAIASCCDCDDKPAPDDGSADYSDLIAQNITEHEHYTTVTTISTGTYFVCCGLPALYHMANDTLLLASRNTSARNRSAAAWDCAATIACIAISEGLAFTMMPQVMGPRVITNLAISGAKCGQTISYVGRTHAEKKSHGGVTYADKYFLTAGELNNLITSQVRLNQAGGDGEVSVLGVAARTNTRLFNQAHEGKVAQSFVARRAGKFVSCGGYGYQSTNQYEVSRKNAMAGIHKMRSGIMPQIQHSSQNLQPKIMK